MVLFGCFDGSAIQFGETHFRLPGVFVRIPVIGTWMLLVSSKDCMLDFSGERWSSLEFSDGVIAIRDEISLLVLDAKISHSGCAQQS